MTPQPPEGAPRAGERYRHWVLGACRVVALFFDAELAEWFVVVRYDFPATGLNTDTWSLAFWLQPVRGDDGQPVPRFAMEE